MAFTKKFGNLFKLSISSNPSIYQAIRCMSSSKLFVGGLSYNTDDQSLREAFTNYGHVIEARVIVDRETGRSRGFGFVTFTSSDEASNAINVMDGKDLHGRLIRVNYATDRARGGGGYVGGGSYGGDSGGWTGSYGGSSGGGYGAAGARGGYGSSGATGGYGGGGASGGYGGDSYGAGGSGGFGGSSDSYGSGSSAGNYSVAGGSYGSESFDSGAARSEGFASTGSAGICGGSGAAGYGSSGADQYGSSKDSAGASHGSRDFSSQQDDSFEGNHVDDDDEPNKYVDKQS